MKQVIRLTESDLRNLINESVRRIIEGDIEKEWDENDDYINVVPDQEVDVLNVYANKGLYDEYEQEDDNGNQLVYNVLEENIPTALVNIKSSYSEQEYDTGWPGGHDIENYYISKNDANTIKQLEQNGQIPQGMADDLIAAIEQQGYEQAQDYIEGL